MSILKLITQPFIMFFQVQKILFNIDPIGTIILGLVSVYWSIGIIVLNKPMVEVATFSLIKCVKKQGVENAR